MSKYDYKVICPKCGAKPYRSCVTAAGKSTDTHRARIDTQFQNPRMLPIKRALEEVYGEGAMVMNCAYRIAEDWDKYRERSLRYDPDDAERVEEAFFREVHNTIWMMFPGGSTAEYAANEVKRALTDNDLWSAA